MSYSADPALDAQRHEASESAYQRACQRHELAWDESDTLIICREQADSINDLLVGDGSAQAIGQLLILAKNELIARRARYEVAA
jgi:hypothetical protein